MADLLDARLDADALPPAVVEAARAALPGAEPARAHVVGRGWDAVAWRVPAADGDWLLRVPRHPGAVPVIEAQHHLGALLAAHGLPVPREPGLLRDAGGAVVAGVYRFVDGVPAHVPGRAERRRLATAIAGLLSALHPLSQEAVASCEAHEVDAWSETFGPLIERCAGLVPPATEAWVRATGRRLEAASAHPAPPALVHADLKPDHVLLSADGAIAAVLDFEGVQVSDPALDFSRLIQHWGDAFAARVFREYVGPVDPGFMVRARCYRDLDALQVIDSARELGWSEWLPWARRDLAARAAAATRRERRGATG